MTQYEKKERNLNEPCTLIKNEKAHETPDIRSRLFSSLLEGARSHLLSRGFVEAPTPLLTKGAGSCEHPSTLFRVEGIFKGSGDGTQDENEMYLCQTGQLYLETLLSTHDRVYTLSQSFRKEPQEDQRHLLQFNLLEIEFRGDYEHLLTECETLIYTMVSNACARTRISNPLDRPFARISYPDARTKLGLSDRSLEKNLSHEQELELVRSAGGPVFLTHFPPEMKYFNMKQQGERTSSADLLLPYSGEALGGGERETDPKTVTQRLQGSEMFLALQEQGGRINDFQWYLDSLNPSRPHSGCGIGIERVMQYLLKTPDIRTVCPFTTTPLRIW